MFTGLAIEVRRPLAGCWAPVADPWRTIRGTIIDSRPGAVLVEYRTSGGRTRAEWCKHASVAAIAGHPTPWAAKLGR